LNFKMILILYQLIIYCEKAKGQNLLFKTFSYRDMLTKGFLFFKMNQHISVLVKKVATHALVAAPCVCFFCVL
jgi:hypothetical protein